MSKTPPTPFLTIWTSVVGEAVLRPMLPPTYNLFVMSRLFPTSALLRTWSLDVTVDTPIVELVATRRVAVTIPTSIFGVPVRVCAVFAIPVKLPINVVAVTTPVTFALVTLSWVPVIIPDALIDPVIPIHLNQ